MLDDPAPMARPSGRAHYFPDVSDASWNDWKWQYRNRIRDVDALARFLAFSPEQVEALRRLAPRLHIGIPPYYLSLIDPADPEDPIRKQAAPSLEEFTLKGAGISDPLAEDSHMPVPGVVHKYPDRALFIATSMCPMYCRHCTRRREWDEGEQPKNKVQLDAMIGYIRATPAIRDVIFSGGDPLSLPLATLDYCLGELRKIPHVEIIRIGTRYPVVLPQRITDELLAVLEKHLPLWLNTHFNHPNELTPEAAAACRRIIRTGIPVNNQSVLLKGVNDDADTMLKLSHGLLRMGVRPYYLFQCDPVVGAEHLRTSPWKGVEILEKMRGHTSGLAIPTFVLDTEGGGKVPLNPNYLLYATDDSLVLRNYEGRIFRYPLSRSDAAPGGSAPPPKEPGPSMYRPARPRLVKPKR